MSEQKRNGWQFAITHAGEANAGFLPYNEVCTILLDYTILDDILRDPDIIAMFKDVLASIFDGAKVEFCGNVSEPLRISPTDE